MKVTIEQVEGGFIVEWEGPRTVQIPGLERVKGKAIYSDISLLLQALTLLFQDYGVMPDDPT